jgi:hypothetical protein
MNNPGHRCVANRLSHIATSAPVHPKHPIDLMQFALYWHGFSHIGVMSGTGLAAPPAIVSQEEHPADIKPVASHDRPPA